MNFRRLAVTALAVPLALSAQRSPVVRTALVPSAIAIVQQDAQLPASNMNAAARLAASPRKGEWVKIPWGDGKSDSLMAWIVKPQNLSASSKAPVVVVVHEIFGLSTWIRGVADQFAAQGFIAIAPDLASRIRGGPTTNEMPMDSSGIFRNPGIPMADRNAGIVSVAKYAMSQPNAIQKYGVVGFCWGGQTTWGHAVHGGAPGFAGGVPYYGAFPYTKADSSSGKRVNVPIADSLARINVPMMLLNGDRDTGISAQMPTIDSVMKAMHKSYVGTNYKDAVHGFARAQDDPTPTVGRGGNPIPRDTAAERGNLVAIKDAWPRTIQFFNQLLRK
jgi:carboxymethylenebutenolidase